MCRSGPVAFAFDFGSLREVLSDAVAFNPVGCRAALCGETSTFGDEVPVLGWLARPLLGVEGAEVAVRCDHGEVWGDEGPLCGNAREATPRCGIAGEASILEPEPAIEPGLRS